MKQFLLTAVILLASAGLITAVVIGSQNNTDSQPVQTSRPQETATEVDDATSADIFYWGTTCPYCHDVIDWIKHNAAEDKLSIISKEVYNDSQNAQQLTQHASLCGLDTASIGVPFMYTTQGTCLIGFPDITNYLAQKMEAIE